MPQRRVLAPVLSGEGKLTGPASYFPRIEETYGQPVQHWLDIAVDRLDAGDTHMQAVQHLKTDHSLGHGHANAVVAYAKAHLD